MRLELGREPLAEASERGLAGGVRRVPPGAGEVGGAAAGVHDPPAAALDHPRHDRPAAEVGAEDVHLEDVPPLGDVGLPRAALPQPDAGVVHEQVDRTQLALDLGDHPLDVVRAAHVGLDGQPVQLARHGVHLPARPGGHRHARSSRGQLARDPGADAATAARDERHLSLELALSRRHARSPRATRGSRATRGRPGPGRAPAHARRGARSSRCASSAALPRTRPAPAGRPCPAPRRPRPRLQPRPPRGRA